MELEHEQAKAKWNELIEEGDIWMAKDMPAKGGDNTERKPWKKKQYAGMLVNSELRDNRFFKDEEYLDSKYSRVEEKGRCHWVDDKGNKFFLDDPIERTQYFLTIEVLDGDKKGDWCWVWAPHRFGYKKDNTVFGVRAKIALAIDENFDINSGIEDDNSDLLRKPFFFTAEPKSDPQYCKVTDFLPMEAEDKVKYVLGAEEVTAQEGDEEIPFHHRAFTHEVGHAHYTQRRTALW